MPQPQSVKASTVQTSEDHNTRCQSFERHNVKASQHQMSKLQTSKRQNITIPDIRASQVQTSKHHNPRASELRTSIRPSVQMCHVQAGWLVPGSPTEELGTVKNPHRTVTTSLVECLFVRTDRLPQFFREGQTLASTAATPSRAICLNPLRINSFDMNVEIICRCN